MLPQPDRQLSTVGGFMVIVGLVALYLIRHP